MPTVGLRSRPPRVSVIIATFDWSSVLRHAIASVLDQRFGDYELLVVGDACTDDSEQVAASFGDRRVRWHNRAANFGSQVGPNNTGLAMARGTYVAYLGQDDLWLPDHLELLVDRLDETGADMAFTIASLVHPDGARWVSGLTQDGVLAADSYVVPSSMMHRLDLVQRVGPWADHRDIGLPADADWQIRARSAGARIVGVERLTVIKFPAGLRPNSYVTRSDAEQTEWSRRIRADPSLEARELAGLLRRSCAGELERLGVSDRIYRPPGQVARRLRVVRGVEAGVQPVATAPLPESVGAASLPLAIEAAPASVRIGSCFKLEIDVANLADRLLTSEPPHPVHLSYHWYRPDGSIAEYDGRRSAIEPLPPGARATLQVEVIAPAEPGRYCLRPCLVQEHVRWLDEPLDALPRFWLDVVAAGDTGSA